MVYKKNVYSVVVNLLPNRGYLSIVLSLVKILITDLGIFHGTKVSSSPKNKKQNKIELD